jgi:EmrB/QacA subfamily drug resistance transporter
MSGRSGTRGCAVSEPGRAGIADSEYGGPVPVTVAMRRLSSSTGNSMTSTPRAYVGYLRDRGDVRPVGDEPLPIAGNDEPTGPVPLVGGAAVPHRPSGGPKSANRWRVLAIVGVAQLMVVLDTTIVNIALPSAQNALGFGAESRQWVVTAYSLAFGSLLLIGGRLSDVIGRRRTLLIGLIGFAAASAVGGAAVSFGMLVAARATQGVFAAILAPAALSTLNVAFAEGRERSRAFGVYAAIASGGAVVGLLLGGALSEWLSWRWCLYVNLALALPAAAAVLLTLPGRDVGRGRLRQLDWPGVLSVSGSLFCLVYGLSRAETASWTAALTIGMFVASATLLVAFVLIELRTDRPLLPLHIVTDRNRVGSYLAIGIAFCAMFGVFLFLTYYLQQTLRYSPLMTGVAFLPFAAGIALTAGLSNTQLVPRVGPRPLVPIGMMLAAVGMFWLRHLSATSTYVDAVLAPLIVLGLGVGLTFAPAIATATWGLPDDDAGVGSAMVNTSQQVGGAIGTAVLSTIFTSAVTRYATSHPPKPTIQAAAAIHGYAVAFTVACGLFLVGAVLTAALLRSGPPAAYESRRQQSEGGATNELVALRERIAELESENRYLSAALQLRGSASAPQHHQR